MNKNNDSSAFRLGVGIMLVNADKKVFVGQRVDVPDPEVWQMPQGGIDHPEDPETALWREMKEEVGSNLGEIIAESQEWYVYDLPPDFRPTFWGGQFQGQKLKWFLVKFLGEDKDINIQTQIPEFTAWRWADFMELPDLIVPFKKDMYLKVAEEFSSYFDGV